MSIFYHVLSGIIFLAAVLLELGGEFHPEHYLAAIFFMMVAIYYQKYED